MDPQASLVYSSRMTSLFKMPQWFHVAHHQESTCSQYSFPRADITKVHTLGVLKQQKYIFLTVLESRRLALSAKALGKNALNLPCLFKLLEFLGLWQHHSSLCLSSYA